MPALPAKASVVRVVDGSKGKPTSTVEIGQRKWLCLAQLKNAVIEVQCSACGRRRIQRKENCYACGRGGIQRREGSSALGRRELGAMAAKGN